MPRTLIDTPASDPDASLLGAYPTILLYERAADARAVRMTFRGLTNHELREVLIGVWATLDADDRADLVDELTHDREALADPDRYPDRYLSPLAEAIRLSVAAARERGE